MESHTYFFCFIIARPVLYGFIGIYLEVDLSALIRQAHDPAWGWLVPNLLPNHLTASPTTKTIPFDDQDKIFWPSWLDVKAATDNIKKPSVPWQQSPPPAKNLLCLSHTMSSALTDCKLPQFKALSVHSEYIHLKASLYMFKGCTSMCAGILLTVASNCLEGGGWGVQKVCRVSESPTVLYIQDQLCTLSQKHLPLSLSQTEA